ncbi:MULTISPECIES: ArsR/SmtB family transcription factor [Bacillus]|jgi:DNA-binding transcriptional ArsR family regulator|uniref:ArsR/SmtB family transcription factor n=1 Tax=Bacillus TaxID=1386 RepID=UPI0022E3A1D2|nr:helix-turn-helix transcriptional regulator [Bacillus smithii]MED0661226.1 helix-turn-helix transcriptional regulator [Bacillus smithii]MED1421607.1 helix-turn-helix transcriptional regulator [Bacillus smithii]MED1457216.1 helix-turn-helix transcriptional regulator [Bacillus smithii]MED1489897.1 helix-turn-helix transcriptional regulator [Bacillus smithii]
MDTMMMLKALSNETRYNILKWLKHPEQHFGPHLHVPNHDDFKGGVCVGDIQEKAGLAQSVVSNYLLMMQKAGLLESKRIGKWTYYRRNEKMIREFIEQLDKDL